ncbi:MAG: PEGA domain-containing protein [Planctomycetes bacterium]|nr:PEGA domain-containing protein [Planctomycetota bacterium]
MRRSLRGALLAAALTVVGCTSPVLVDSTPQGALLLVDGEPVGRTPITIHAVRSRFVGGYDLRLELPGHEPHELRLERRQALIMGSRGWPPDVHVRLVPAGAPR